MNISDYDYSLPEERIAIYPPEIRGASRLLVLHRQSGAITHKLYRDLPDLLQPGDTVVINETKVIKARLIARNQHDKERELLLLEKHGSDDDWHVHKALHRGTVKKGDVLAIGATDIEVVEILGDGLVLLKCAKNLLDVAQAHGSVPLPPYMKRDAKPEDIERYQTEFAKEAGSVAAPTASLNLTEELVQDMKDKGIIVCRMTLHVGMGTFLPIRSESVEKHQMHKEYFEIPVETVAAVRQAKQEGHKVIPIGTTVTRALEYSSQQVLNGEPQDITGEADIFIYPGYDFQVVDALVTNFHAPRSTVLMMAAALAGWENLKLAYEDAVSEKYAFLSYGDSMLITD